MFFVLFVDPLICLFVWVFVWGWGFYLFVVVLTEEEEDDDDDIVGFNIFLINSYWWKCHLK